MYGICTLFTVDHILVACSPICYKLAGNQEMADFFHLLIIIIIEHFVLLNMYCMHYWLVKNCYRFIAKDQYSLLIYNKCLRHYRLYRMVWYINPEGLDCWIRTERYSILYIRDTGTVVEIESECKTIFS